MTNPTTTDAAKARAEALFKRQQLLDSAPDGRRAMEAARVAEAEKTARLRELRLARERADKIAVDVGQPRKP